MICIISLETVSEKKEKNSTLIMSLIHCAIMGISFSIRPMTEQKNPMSTKKFVNSFFSGKKSVNIIIFLDTRGS